MAGVSTTITAIAIATAFRVLYWRREQCKQISNGCLEIFKRIITLLNVTILFLFTFFNLILDAPRRWVLGCALTFASEAKFEIEAKISFRLEAKKKPVFTWFTSMRNTKNLKRKRRENKQKLSEKIEAKWKLSKKKRRKSEKKAKKSEKKQKNANVRNFTNNRTQPGYLILKWHIFWSNRPQQSCQEMTTLGCQILIYTRRN